VLKKFPECARLGQVPHQSGNVGIGRKDDNNFAP